MYNLKKKKLEPIKKLTFAASSVAIFVKIFSIVVAAIGLKLKDRVKILFHYMYIVVKHVNLLKENSCSKNVYTAIKHKADF